MGNTNLPAINRLNRALILLLSLLGIMTAVPKLLYAAPTCTMSGPPNSAYTITLCITAPADGAVLSGPAPITATVSVTGANPGVQKLIWYLDGQYLLTDYAAAYTFVLPTAKFVDGTRLLETEAFMRDGFTSARAANTVTFSNGVTVPPVNTNTFTPPTGSTPAPGRPFVLATTGDGASGEPKAGAVTDLIASWNPNLFLYLGDVYDDGTPTEFYNWYGTGSNFYSRFRAITNPTVGNHEYQGHQAPGYFDYWDNIPHYYSFNAAGWHVINLDSTSQFNQAAPGTSQYNWLVQDLNASTAACTIVYFHHPLYNVGPEGDATRMNDIWTLLAQHGVDIVLTGHDHTYQRWYALNGQGALDPNGVTQFVVGTGGHGIQDAVRSDSRLAVGFFTPPSAFGALRLELNQDGAAYQFVNIQGAVLDAGSIGCSGAPPDTTPPGAPANLSATSTSSTHADLTWTSATDNVGVTSYDIYRNGVLVATTGAAASYTDNTVTGGTAYQYQVRARDAAGSVSTLSSIAPVTTAALLFSDGFESGNLSKWSGVTGLIVQQQEVYSSTYAARETSTGAATWAYRPLSPAPNELYYRLRFKIVSQGSNVYLLKFRTSTGGSILGLYVSSNGTLAYRNDAAMVTTTTATNVTAGVWHDVQVRVRIDGTNGLTEVWLDGVRVDALSKTESLGTTPIGRIQLGDNSGARTYDVALDNVTAHTTFIDIITPSVALSEPAANAAVRGSVTFAAEALDNVGMDRVEFLVNGTLVGTDYTPPYNVIWNSTTLGDGPATITARAVDNTFNPTDSISRIVTVDNTPPNTTIDSGPSGTVGDTSATFTFSSSEAGATIACVLDDVETEFCASPVTYDNLAEGPHTFQVVSTDAAGNIDPIPASRDWTVDAPATPTATETPLPPPPTATETPLPPPPTATPTPTPVVSTLTFVATADAYVNANSPTTNYGAMTTLRADASPDIRSYLRFTVQGLPGPATRATLRVYATSGSDPGYAVRSVSDNTWGESTITYNNAPPTGSVLGSSGTFSASMWTSVDITPYITGNGTYNLALTTSSNSAISFASLQSSANAPQLVVESAGGFIPTPTATPVSDLIFSDGLESGNLSAWSASTTDGGDLSVSLAAALTGSYGLQAVLDDNILIDVTDDTPNAEARYRARFYFDPNSIAMANNDAHYVFYGYSGASTVVLRVELRRNSASYQLRAALRNDSNGWTSTAWSSVTDAPHIVELDWRAATAAGANNGGLTLWIDNAQRADLTGVDNDTRRIDRVRWGAVEGIDSGTRGTYYLDAFESRRQSYIGP